MNGKAPPHTPPEISRPLKWTVYVSVAVMVISVVVGGIIMTLRDGDFGVMLGVKLFIVFPAGFVFCTAMIIIALRESRAKRENRKE